MERMGNSGKVPANKDIWLCMTCKQCTQICQFGVRFHEVVREIRPELRKALPPEPNHGGALEALERLTAMPSVQLVWRIWKNCQYHHGQVGNITDNHLNQAWR